MLNELRYNVGDFDRVDEEDGILVFKGNVYPIFTTDTSEENIQYVLNILRELCKVYDGLYENFFEKDGTLKDYLRNKPINLLGIIEGNFENLPKLLYGRVTVYNDRYSLAFDYSMYDVANSQEFKQLMKSDIVDQFSYILLNDKVYTLEEIRNGEFENRKEDNTNIAPRLYHGTTTNYLYSILTKGLRQVEENSKFKVVNSGYVYLTSVYETAHDYAKGYVREKGGEKCIIVVDTNKIDKNNIVLDYDFANEYTTDIENSPYKGRIKPKNSFYKGNVAKNASNSGTKYGKIGYKGIIMPNAILGAYIYEDNKRVFYDKSQLLYIYRPLESKTNNRNMLREYTSRFYEGQSNFKIKAYHTARRDSIYDIFSDGYLDPKAEHKGECPYDIIWFTIENDDYDGPFKFSFEVDENTFKEMDFEWMNDIHLVTPHKIDIMDKRLRIEKINGVSVDELFERFYDKSSKHPVDDFIDHAFQLTKYEISNELFVMKLLQQYGFKRSDWFTYEDSTEMDESKGKVQAFTNKGLMETKLKKNKKKKNTYVNQGIMSPIAMGDMCSVGCLEESQINDETVTIYSDNFKKWFGDWENDPDNSSKVVDKDGKPMPVYHGTTKLDNGKPFKIFRTDINLSTSMFSDSQSIASFFSGGGDSRFDDYVKNYEMIDKNSIKDMLRFINYTSGEKHVIKEINITGTEEKFYRLESEHISSPLGRTTDEVIKSLTRECEKLIWNRNQNANSGGIYKVYLNIRNPYIVDAKGCEFDKIQTDLYREPISVSAIGKLVKNIGKYDGVIIKNVRETTYKTSPSTDYLVFNPNQIKHALDNSGEFSPNNDSIIESIITEVDAKDISLKSFKIQDELNPKFWINNKINSRVRLKLLDLADEFIESLAVDWVKPKDIVITGSIANYNWSKYSDVDVHILFDFKEVWKKTEFVQDYFDSKKALWSQEHEQLKIYGFPVEMYVEDTNEDNPSSGIYSLNKNKWIVEPNDFQDAQLNEPFIKDKAAKIMTEIDDIDDKIKKEKDNHKLEVLSTKLKKLFDKLHKQRQESLDKNGEMGTYNIIWKVLRRSGHLDKIWEIINTVYNRVNSIK